MQISIDQAKALCAVVECGGYAKAAENLHKSHSALIYLLKGLEEQCGFAIFDRKAYRNTLTPSGRRVYQACLDILAKVEELARLCDQLNQGWEPSVRIVFDGILPFGPFLKIYKKFKSEKAPTVVQTYADYLQDVEKSFHSLVADIMISILPVESPDLEAVSLKTFKSYLVAHKNHPIHKNHKRWSLEELHQFYFLTIRSPHQSFGLNTLEFEKSASFFMSDFSAKKEAILKEVGFGWLPEHMIESELKNQILLPVKWERKSTHEVKPTIYIRKQAVGGRAISLIVELLKSGK